MNQTPHHPDAERSIIGACLLDPQVIDEIRTLVTPSDFYSPIHRDLYTACVDIWTNEGELEPTILVEYMRANNNPLDSEDLMRMIGNTPFAATAPRHAKFVRDAAKRRSVIDAAAQIAHLMADSGDQDTDSLCGRAIDIVSEAAGARLSHADRHLRDLIPEVIQDAENGFRRVYTTGIEDFDEKFGGIPMQGVVAVFGCNGSGKSTLGYNILRRLAVVHGVSSRVFSFEVNAHAATASILSAESQEAVHSILRGSDPATPAQLRGMQQGAERLKPADIAFVEDDIDISSIYQRCARYRADGVKCVMIDYIQNLPAPTELLRAGDAARVAFAAKQCQRIARSLDMLVLMVCQMTIDSKRKQDPRKTDDGIPIPHHDDIIGSSSVSDVIDFGIGVWRSSLWVPDQMPGETTHEYEDRRREAILCVTKNKFGPSGISRANYIGKYLLFETNEPTHEQREFGAGHGGWNE